MEKITLRPEKTEDRAQVATLIARAYGADGAFVVELAAKLRAHNAAGAPLAFVGETAKGLAAFALFTPLEFDGVGKVAFMSPIAADERQEIAMEDFMQNAYKTLAEQSYTHVAVLGDADEMLTHGFKKSEKLQSTPQQTQGDVLLMALNDDALPEGVLKLPEFLAEG